MKNKKIIIAGGTGFIGEEMIRYWGKENKIVILSRQVNNEKNNRNKQQILTDEELQKVVFRKWDGKTAGQWAEELEGADIVINLAGKTVNCRYNKKNKEEILNSRINAVKAIGSAIQLCKKAPALWINSSSATIYRYADDHAQDEYNGEFENDFSVQVCKQWEKILFEQSVPATRRVALRMAITLGTGGVMIPYFNLLKFGLGGKQGNGKQMYSWVHIEDTCRMIEWIAEREQLHGIYNCSSPNPVSNETFMRTLREVTGCRLGLPASKWMLKLGALIMGTETELILKSRWVLPTRILETGFQFKYPFLKDAMENIIAHTPARQYHLI